MWPHFIPSNRPTTQYFPPHFIPLRSSCIPHHSPPDFVLFSVPPRLCHAPYVGFHASNQLIPHVLEHIHRRSPIIYSLSLLGNSLAVHFRLVLNSSHTASYCSHSSSLSCKPNSVSLIFFLPPSTLIILLLKPPNDICKNTFLFLWVGLSRTHSIRKKSLNVFSPVGLLQWCSDFKNVPDSPIQFFWSFLNTICTTGGCRRLRKTKSTRIPDASMNKLLQQPYIAICNF